MLTNEEKKRLLNTWWLNLDMPLHLAIKRLENTIVKLKRLHADKFDYSNFVTKLDSETKCPTVCCVAGWYPTWFKNSGFIWEETAQYYFRGESITKTLGVVGGKKDKVWFMRMAEIKAQLIKWHGLDTSVIEYLFFGAQLRAAGPRGSIYYDAWQETGKSKAQIKYDILLRF